MSNNADHKATAPEHDSEPAGQDLPLAFCKGGDETNYTFVGSAEDVRVCMGSFGTANTDFFFGLLHQVANVGSKGRLPDERGIKFVLGFIKASKPRDEIDAMLLSQIGGFQLATMRALNRLAHAETLQEQDSAERASNKLGRTLAVFVDALQRYRLASKQNVYVQNVSVNEGGQAIVANVAPHGRRVAPNKRRRVSPAPTDARQAPMEFIDEGQRAPKPLQRRQKG